MSDKPDAPEYVTVYVKTVDENRPETISVTFQEITTTAQKTISVPVTVTKTPVYGNSYISVTFRDVTTPSLSSASSRIRPLAKVQKWAI
jgi:hypothetical protein